ncbi:hypothetical protein PR048_023613 [Dryococelus australis]|uniref:Uncharacterized protein n=1 Tax=Dryococelus australis TaxID=614101 RepID=A0ABQ9GUM8_9NEOP|nr:hypothetical protein PR048_023613 [Dryococelus australis]
MANNRQIPRGNPRQADEIRRTHIKRRSRHYSLLRVYYARAVPSLRKTECDYSSHTYSRLSGPPLTGDRRRASSSHENWNPTNNQQLPERSTEANSRNFLPGRTTACYAHTVNICPECKYGPKFAVLSTSNLQKS